MTEELLRQGQNPPRKKLHNQTFIGQQEQEQEQRQKQQQQQQQQQQRQQQRTPRQ